LISDCNAAATGPPTARAEKQEQNTYNRLKESDNAFIIV
jgi:hypothetical protein